MLTRKTATAFGRSPHFFQIFNSAVYCSLVACVWGWIRWAILGLLTQVNHQLTNKTEIWCNFWRQVWFFGSKHRICLCLGKLYNVVRAGDPGHKMRCLTFSAQSFARKIQTQIAQYLTPYICFWIFILQSFHSIVVISSGALQQTTQYTSYPIHF